jgi:hypothetical protein
MRQSKKQYKQMRVDEKPKQLAVNEPLMCINGSIDEISQRCNISFEDGEGQCGRVKHTLIYLGKDVYMYIHKWELDDENLIYIDTNINANKQQDLRSTFKLIKDYLFLKDDEIDWVTPKALEN